MECPHCDTLMPRAQTCCPSCGLSFEESLRRSDKPVNEQPPRALYFNPEAPLRDDQKFYIGLSFCAAFITLGFGRWLPGILLLALGSFLTPAIQGRLKLSQRQYVLCLLAAGVVILISFWQ